MPVPGFAPPQTQTLTATGVTPSVKILSLTYVGRATTTGSSTNAILPSIGVNVTGTVTYTVQWSGDDYTAPGYSDASANWFPFTGMAGLTSSSSATIGAAMTMVRLNATISSGTATFSVCQQGN